jgi:hypothetical protein
MPIALGWPELEPAARLRGFEREAHLDIGGGELAAGEPLALAELAFPIVHVLLELRIDQRGQRLVGDLAHQRRSSAGARFGISVNSSFSSSGGIAEPSA